MIDSDRENFNQDYITRELNRVDEVLTEKLSIYLLGGAVMAMNDLKPGTKDIDVIVKNKGCHRILVSSLEKCDYYLIQPQDLSVPYMGLSATALQNIEGFRWEIFIKYVAKKLALTDTMELRAGKIYFGKRITVFRLSNEDMFLMKGMTERERDLEDMALIARSDINYDIVLEECKYQSKRDRRGNIWEASLYEKCEELKKKYGINVPIRDKLRKISEEKMIKAEKKRALGESH
ncbi:MAG: DUF6036 family nucleotidyltransferase [Thermoplasmataceae archaeon]